MEVEEFFDSKFDDRYNFQVMKVVKNGKYISFRHELMMKSDKKVYHRFPLRMGDTIRVTNFFQWGKGIIAGKSYRVNNDATIEIGNTKRDCYYFIENLGDYYNGVRIEEVNHMYIDKRLLIPIKMVFVMTNKKDYISDTIEVRAKNITTFSPPRKNN